MRKFKTGATRDSDQNKLDFEGFNHPLVDKAFGEYMQEHRKQANGKLRESDNWQKGIPKEVYMKSLMRHAHQLHLLHRGYTARDEKGEFIKLKDVLCALRFNINGYLLEILK